MSEKLGMAGSQRRRGKEKPLSVARTWQLAEMCEIWRKINSPGIDKLAEVSSLTLSDLLCGYCLWLEK